MIAHRNLHASNQEASRAGSLSDRLRLMFDWYKGWLMRTLVVFCISTIHRRMSGSAMASPFATSPRSGISRC